MRTIFTLLHNKEIPSKIHVLTDRSNHAFSSPFHQNHKYYFIFYVYFAYFRHSIHIKTTFLLYFWTDNPMFDIYLIVVVISLLGSAPLNKYNYIS